jgi:hypothetical protein
MKNLLKEMSKSELMSEKNKQVMSTKINNEDRTKRIALIDKFISKVETNSK